MSSEFLTWAEVRITPGLYEIIYDGKVVENSYIFSNTYDAYRINFQDQTIGYVPSCHDWGNDYYRFRKLNKKLGLVDN